jgi:uncharacterized protein (TIGR02147 family)
MPNIFEYLNYRQYLSDYFEEQKQKTPQFSHRFFARQLGLATPNFVLLVIQGKRNLSQSTCLKISQVLKHSNEESQYFEHLVNFMQAKRHEEKDRYFNQLIGMRHKLKVSRLEEWQYEYYSNWYNPVIRELVTQAGFDGDMKALGKRVSPQITGTEAKRSVELLLKLGLIKETAGCYVQSESVISTGNEVNYVAVANFHRKMAQLAAESFDRHLHTERSITACTIYISENNFREVKREIADFRRKILSFAQQDDKADRVYQLNLQLFPLSRPAEGRKEEP